MKRKIAAALAIIMVGAQYATPFVHAEETETTTEATVEVGGSSSIATIDDSVVKVVVPTEKALNFTLDPQGLLAIADGTVTTGKEADLKNYSGRILGNTALVFANKSIRPVTVTTNFQVDGIADNQVVSTKDAVKKPNSTTANLLFMAIPNKDAIQLSYGTGEGASSSEALVDIDNHQTGNSFSGVAAAGGYIFTKTATTVKSVLPEAAHTISFTAGTGNEGGTFDYTLDTANNAKNNAAGFIISGFCNPYGDYSDVSDVSVKASYSFKKATTAEAEATKLDETFAVISAKSGTATTNLSLEAKNKNDITTKSKVKVATAATVNTNPTVTAANGGLVITAGSGKTFANYFTVHTNSSTASNALGWSTAANKPSLSTDKKTWTLPSGGFALMIKETSGDNSGKYVITLKYEGSDETVKAVYTPAN